METSGQLSKQQLERLQRLYPQVFVQELPTCWSSNDKVNWISLSKNDLRVHYKGNGKSHKDAASVRTTCPISVECLMYYFEIKILSKGRDGYMGIGLTASRVNLQRLPGWDKQSYGYHGDDGNSFCSSGNGQPYGPVFTTGDVVGCCYNIVENCCFFTKNGHNLGLAFRDLPSIELYPTVGLQTPGEEIEANFGQEPFVYDIEQDMAALRQRLTAKIINVPVKHGELQSIVNKLIQSWLLYNGYCRTAESFSAATNLEYRGCNQQIKQRLKIQKMVLTGRIPEAIKLSEKLHPKIFEKQPDLLFALKCRQFVEMIRDSYSKNTNINGHGKNGHSKVTKIENGNGCSNGDANDRMDCDEMHDGDGDVIDDDDILDDDRDSRKCDIDENDDLLRLQRLIEFGRDLNNMSNQIKKKDIICEKSKTMLRDALSLLAYSDPFKSPNAYLLRPSERETVCQKLNDALVACEAGRSNIAPPLARVYRHIKTLASYNGQEGGWLLNIE